MDVTAFGYAYGQMAQQPLYFESDKTFVAKSREFISIGPELASWFDCYRRSVLFAGSDKIEAIKSISQKFLVSEMEREQLLLRQRMPLIFQF